MRPLSRHSTIPVGLAVLAFVLALVQRPGLASSDTKIDLHVDPAGFLGDVASVWTSSGSTGHVQGGQYGGYLFPMGPFFAALHAIGLSPWMVQRLWLGALLAVAAWGTVRVVDELYRRRRGWAHVVAGLFIILNPYVVVFANRTSVTLLAYALLPWLMLAVHRGARDPRGWRWPAVFALLLTAAGGGVNTAVIAWILVGPGLLLSYDVWCRFVSPRDALAFLARLAPLTLAASLWWMGPVLVQARYGIDFLQFTEQPGTIWWTPSITESLRLMGYWVSYLGVGYTGPRRAYFTDTTAMLFLAPVVVASLLATALPLLGLRWTRRERYAPFLLLLILAGLAVMTLGWPDGTPLRRAVTFTYNHVQAVQFLRTTYKAGPLVALGLAGLAGIAADHLAGWVLARRGALRRAMPIGLPVAGAALLLLAVWPLTRGHAVDSQVLWKQIPGAWRATAADVDRELPANGRAIVLPGQLYAFYRWGGTVDPILPALTDRPVAVRSSVPYADLRAVDLLWTTDALVQQQRMLPGQLSPLLGLLGADEVVTATDDDRALSAAVPPADADRALRIAGGLRSLGTSGPLQAFAPSAGTIGPERRLAQVRRAAPATPSRGIVRVLPRNPQLVVDGSADAIAGLASLGALPADRPVFYAADRSPAELRAAAAQGGEFVISDSNRRRVFVASRLRQNTGATLAAGTAISQDAAVLDPFPGGGTDAQTVAVYDGVRSVTAPFSPGFAQFPEHRPYAAIDGDPRTAWLADRYLDTDRRELRIGLRSPRDVAAIDLLPYGDARSSVHAVSVNGRRFSVRPGWNRLPVDLHDADAITVKLTGVASASTGGGAGGIRELRIPGMKAAEALRVPREVERGLAGADLAHASLVYLLQRTTGDDPYRRDAVTGPQSAGLVRDRGDGEQAMTREISPPVARSFAVRGLAKVAPDAPDSRLDEIAGVRGGLRAESSGRFQNRPGSRASSALDGSRARAWLGSWDADRGAWVSWTSRRAITLRSLRLEPPAVRVRRPTRIRLVTDGRPGPELAVGADGTVALPAPVRGRSMRLEILDAAFAPGTPGPVRERRAVGIGEIRADGLPRIHVPARGTVATACGAASLIAAGQRVPLRVAGSLRRLDAGLPLPLAGCGARAALELPAGRVRLTTVPATMRPETVELRGAAPDPLLRAAVIPGRVIDPGHGTGGRRDDVRVALNEPSWLVLAESFNRGWRATCDGRDLGAPHPIDAFANGWPAPADCRSVAFRFSPDRPVHVLYILSGLLCLALLVFLGWSAVRRRRRAATPLPGDPDLLPDPDPQPRMPAGRAVAWGIAAALVFGFVFALRAGVVLGPLTALILWRGLSTRALTLAAGLLLVVVVPILYLALPVEDDGGYAFGYAQDLTAAHWVGVVAVVLLLIALVRALRTARRAPS